MEHDYRMFINKSSYKQHKQFILNRKAMPGNGNFGRMTKTNNHKIDIQRRVHKMMQKGEDSLRDEHIQFAHVKMI